MDDDMGDLDGDVDAELDMDLDLDVGDDDDVADLGREKRWATKQKSYAIY